MLGELIRDSLRAKKTKSALSAMRGDTRVLSPASPLGSPEASGQPTEERDVRLHARTDELRVVTTMLSCLLLKETKPVRALSLIHI